MEDVRDNPGLHKMPTEIIDGILRRLYCRSEGLWQLTQHRPISLVRLRRQLLLHTLIHQIRGVLMDGREIVGSDNGELLHDSMFGFNELSTDSHTG